jgi:hypothetical protein
MTDDGDKRVGRNTKQTCCGFMLAAANFGRGICVLKNILQIQLFKSVASIFASNIFVVRMHKHVWTLDAAPYVFEWRRKYQRCVGAYPEVDGIIEV